MALGLALTTLGATAQFSKKEQTPPPAPVPNTPVQVNERLFSKPRMLLLSTRKEQGGGVCAGTVGPVWGTDEGVVIEMALNSAERCSFKSLTLHVGGSNYLLSGVDGGFEIRGRSGNYALRQSSGLLYFSLGKVPDVSSFSGAWGVWEHACGDASCFTDATIVEAARTLEKTQQERAAAEKERQEAQVLQQRTAGCIAAAVPNPNPLRNETTRFYGDCAGGKAQNGIVMWLQTGQAFGLSCMKSGEYVPSYKVALDEMCTKFLKLLPSYCGADNYQGQCREGKPEGVGILSSSEKVSLGSTTYRAQTGQFRSGKPEGYGSMEAIFGCGFLGCTGGTEGFTGFYENGALKMRCEGGPEGCASALIAEPIYKNARAAADAFRCDEAEALDRKAQAMDGQTHSESSQRNGERISYSSCRSEAGFARSRNSKDPQAIYLAASRYESDGERSRAKTLYRLIVDKFETSPMAIKAADRLTRLADVEAVESSNSNAAYQVQRSQEDARKSNYEQCMNAYSACRSRCDSLPSSSRYSCNSGCTACSR
jgi:hypothetical protein